MTKKYWIQKREIFKDVPQVHKNISGPVDFETAIAATGFGRYNLLLILIAIPSSWASIFETTTMSYVFPAAQCDLDLSLDDKGLLNAITYFGMISSALIWGFLYDTLGRKKLLCIGFVLDAVFVIGSSLSQTKTFLMVSKFCGGFIINGPFAALSSYISEFHSAKYRAKMQLVLGTINSVGSVVLPLMAWAILPNSWYFSFFGLDLHAWNIYLLVTSLASLSSCLIFLVMPESPKFLMTTGRNEQALKIFQTVYCVNSGESRDSFPIKELIKETEMENANSPSGNVTANRTKLQALREGWQQMKPLFFPPHLANIILVCLLLMLFALSLNTLRLWLPQIFQAINDYQYYHNDTSASLCDMLSMIQPHENVGKCTVNMNNSSVYINSMIVASVAICSYGLAGLLITFLGKKRLMTALGVISGLSAFMMYFSSNMAVTIAFSSIFISAGSIATNVVIAVIIDLFPTTLRTTTVSLAMMLGRIGAIIGNLVFPILLRTGCAPPFFSIGSVITFCAFLALLLPNTDLKALQ